MTITGITYLKVSVVYFVIGILLGMYMSMNHDYDLGSVHAHVNLLGWASFALAGVIYWLFPRGAASLLGVLQFWTHMIGFPVMMIALALVMKGNAAFERITALGATLVAVSVLLFAVNVFLNVRPEHGTRK
ncbi:cytochrome-c oxidase [Paenibacillus sp. A14]|uniref:cytochrome-c oxidase n=1 Tax=Paenibacillus sp. A14 TaxID=3119820 RepID=UPI002FE23DCA